MGYYNDNQGRRPNNGSYDNRTNDRRKEPTREVKVEIKPMKVPDDYVDAAEQVILKIGRPNNKKGKFDFDITTTKLRNILSLVSDIYNIENRRTGEKISDVSSSKLQMLRIRVLYEAGRDKKVERFVEKSCLLQYIKGIDSKRENMLRFAHYMESLVAYHRYYGGDN